MKTSQMLKVIPIATLALLMSCSGNKSEEATETQNEKVKGESGDGLCSRRGATQ